MTDFNVGDIVKLNGWRSEFVIVACVGIDTYFIKVQQRRDGFRVYPETSFYNSMTLVKHV